MNRSFWDLKMYVPAGVELELPTAWDPIDHPDLQHPPLSEIERVVDQLADRGWEAFKTRTRAAWLESLYSGRGEEEAKRPQGPPADEDIDRVIVELARNPWA